MICCWTLTLQMTPVRQTGLTLLQHLTLFPSAVLSVLHCQVLRAFFTCLTGFSYYIHLSSIKGTLTRVSASMNTHFEYCVSVQQWSLVNVTPNSGLFIKVRCAESPLSRTSTMTTSSKTVSKVFLSKWNPEDSSQHLFRASDPCNIRLHSY